MQRARFLFLVALGVVCVLSAVEARADVYGRIRGTVTDPSGAVIPKAKVTALNIGTGISVSTTSGADGSYEFLQLAAPGIYNVSAQAAGFKDTEVDGVQLQLNQIFVENLKMELGSITEKVSVTETATVQVETTSIELGQVINGTTIINSPLNGRNVVDLMQLQPGVVAASDARGGSGEGNFASNGSQAEQDSYLINGIDNNELDLNTILINPSPDAVSEFKMVTNTMNPEYGRNSGAIMNLEIKSGTNQFHGSGFDFYRDTFLNARNFFRPDEPFVFHRNQFGGTVGGPIWKDHTFFFFSYEGSRESRPENSGDCGCSSPGTVQLLTSSEKSGGFPDIATSSTPSPFPLVGENGTTYPAGTPYSTIFPTGQIPSVDFNSVSQKLLSFVPTTATGVYTFSPLFRALSDQYIARMDHTFSSKDGIWGYFLWQRAPDTQDLPFVGATLPGFGETDNEHFQQYAIAWTHTFSSTTLNEARVGYTRFNFVAITPTTPAAPSSAGFQINPQLAADEGLPAIQINGPGATPLNFWLGFSEDGPQPRIDNTYQVSDSFTKIVGRHSLKMGFDMRRFQVFNPFAHENNGAFDFFGTGPFSTGDVGADFLLGIPDEYAQGSGDTADARTREYYSYFQDQWKIRANLTLTYGTGWSIDTPLDDIAHNNHAGIAFRPGQQSTVFPTAPTGYVFQGDQGVNAFGTTKYRHFGPRVGIAFSPNWGWLTGGPGKTSIRAGYGIYYNRFNEEIATQTQGSPPFALASAGIGDIGGSPSFANPFAGYALVGGVPTTISIPNKFPYAPAANPDFSNLLPLVISVYDPNITIPDAQNYNLTIERQIGSNTVVSVGYVGAQARHLLLTVELNPGINPAACLATPIDASGLPTCVDERDSQPVNFPANFRYPQTTLVNGTPVINFASIGDVTTTGTSNYNALQVSVNRNLSHGLQFEAGYTWSHALDLASGFENAGFGGSGFGGFGQLRSTNPFNPSVDYGNSNFDARHRLVISYYYEIPSVRHFAMFQRIPARIADGWRISGLTTFQSGFPLDVVDGALPSLTASLNVFYFGDGASWDVPNLSGPIQYANPRTPVTISPGVTTNYWLSPATTPNGCSASAPPCQINGFSAPPFGTEGNAGRDIIHGPGINNFDFALIKDTKVTESIGVQLRMDFFNIFNHTQFDPNGITTDINSSSFGTETAARDPRIIQLAARIYF